MADLIVTSLTYKPTGDSVEPSPTSRSALRASAPSPEELQLGHKVVLTDEDGKLYDGYLPNHLTTAAVGDLSELTTTAKTSLVAAINEAAATGGTGGGGASSWDELTDKPTTFPPSAHIHAISDVTGLQASLDAKVATADPRLTDARTPTAHTHTVAQISDATPFGRTLATATDASAARTTLGTIATEDPRLSDARTPTAHTHLWADLTDKPATFSPSTHAHVVADVTGLSATLTGLQAAIDGKAATTDPRFTDARTPLAHTHAVTDLTATGTRSATTFLRGDNTWVTPTNTTYAVPATSEITAGTATTSRVISADLLKQAVRFWTTGSLTTANTAFGQSFNTVADAAAARTLLNAAASDDPRLSDARTPTAHTHTIANVTGLQSALDTHTHAWDSITGKPTSFTPEAHEHLVADLDVSGTPSATTYLRGDGTWATPSGSGGTGSDINSTQILDSTVVGRAVLTAVDAVAARTAIGAGTSNLAVGNAATDAKAGDWLPSWAEVADKPATFTPATHTHTAAQISDATATGRSVLMAANAAAVRTTIGAGTSNLAVGTTAGTAKSGDWFPTWTEVTGKPTTFAPAAHTHAVTDVTGLSDALDGKVGTTDARLTDARTPLAHTHLWADITDKPTTFAPAAHVHTTAQVTGLDTALAGKAATSHTHLWAHITDKPTTFTPTAHGHVIADTTGLQTALDEKAATSHTHLWDDLTDKPTTFAPATHSHVIADTTGLQTALDGKAATSHTHTIANVTGLQTALDGKAAATHTHLWEDLTDKPATFAPAAHTHVWAQITDPPATYAPSAHTHAAANISDSTTTGRAVLMATDATAARTAIGAGTSNLTIGTTASTAKAGNYVPTWTEVTSKPTTFTPTAHTHVIADVTSLQAALDGKAATSHTHTLANISDATAFGRSLASSADAAAAKTLLEITGSGSVAWADVTDKPATFTPATHSHVWADISNPPATYAPSAHTHLWAELTDKPTTFAPTAHTHVAADISNATTIGRTVLMAADAAAVRTAIGAGTSSLALGTTSSTAKAGDYQPTWTQVTSKPTTFAPTAHTHLWADLTDKPTTFAPSTHSHVATDISNSTATGRSVLTAADAAAGRTAIDAAASSHTHGVGDVTGLQTALDAKAAKASGMTGTGLPWYTQAVLNSGTLASGYNDLKGGLMADRDIVLESMVFWLEEPAGAIGGSGNLTIQWYAGSATAQETTLIHTSTIAAGQHDIWVVLATPTNFAINTVFRPKVTMGTTTVTGACHVQFRGRYQ